MNKNDKKREQPNWTPKGSKEGGKKKKNKK